MTNRPHFEPGPDHPITVTPVPERVVAKANGTTIADTRHALVLVENNGAPVYYLPRADVDMSILDRTQHQTYCPYKGDASYYSVRTDDGELTNAVWSYETPYPALVDLKDHLAFYPNVVDVQAVPE